ncbi:TetR/AcrR family transcriptional regulator [Streptomyces mirabilis]|uniref:TetR/AcrR family transcriptional regulator n=1 Tax=Streptomyces mirabilis TaxID=68239 RepID=UPI0031BB5B81
MARATAKSSARERLLTAADELFYDEGIRSVGIDRVIEHAGVAKASLYNTFGSKDKLIQAYLKGRHEKIATRISAAVQAAETPRERLLAVFDAQGALYAESGFRGCPFVRANAEARPGDTVDRATSDYRAWVRSLFTELAEQAGASDPEALARALHMVYDGAVLSARSEHDPGASAAARAAAGVLLDATLS